MMHGLGYGRGCLLKQTCKALPCQRCKRSHARLIYVVSGTYVYSKLTLAVILRASSQLYSAMPSYIVASRQLYSDFVGVILLPLVAVMGLGGSASIIENICSDTAGM